MEGTTKSERAEQIRKKINESPLKGRCYLISRRWWTELLAYFGWPTPDNDFGKYFSH